VLLKTRWCGLLGPARELVPEFALMKLPVQTLKISYMFYLLTLNLFTLWFHAFEIRDSFTCLRWSEASK
jgi:hypothetical protein